MKMKKQIISIFLLTIILSLAGCGGGSANASNGNTTAANNYEDPITSMPVETTDKPDSNAEETDVLDKNMKYNILFIGNSYTYYNDMPDVIFADIAKSAGYDIEVTKVTKGGWYLDGHADSSDESGAIVDVMLKKNKYDYVIIQEQSVCPAADPGRFYDGARSLLEKVKANGATPILYETWGRKTGNSTLTQYGWTNESMTWKLAAAYKAIGSELSIEVAYAGLAFFDVYTNNRDIELYSDDGSHPSAAGSYLVALTIFAEIFKFNPVEVSFTSNIESQSATILREAARKAVFETPEVPGEYVTSSEGVKAIKINTAVDYSKMKNLTSFPTSNIISVIRGGVYGEGRTFSGILGTKGKIASGEYSASGLSDAQKADIADISYGVSVIGIKKMDSSAKGYTTAVENLVNGHWGSSYMASFEFDDKKYDINGNTSDNGKFEGLITLNFGSMHKFDAMGFFSGSLQGFPGAAEVYVSDDGKNWTVVPAACWDQVNGTKLVSCGTSPADPWSNNTASVTCLFDMGNITGQYIRIGVVIGRNDSTDKYNTINTREIVVYGSKVS